MEPMSEEMIINQRIRAYAPQVMVEFGQRHHGPTSRAYQVRKHFLGDEADEGQLLEPRLLELVRIRCAQLAGCYVCVQANYGPDDESRVDEQDHACLLAEDFA